MMKSNISIQGNIYNKSIDLKITSILLAIFVCLKMLNLIVLAAQPSLRDIFMNSMYVVVVVGLFFVGIIRQKRSLFSIARSHIVIGVLCILWYVVTVTFIGQPSVNIAFFCVFTLGAFFIPGIIRIDVRIFLLTLFILPSFGIIYLDKIVFNSVMEKGFISMGVSYAMLVPVMANLVYLRFYFKEDTYSFRGLMIVFTVINIFYLIQMAMYGSRGPILSVILLIVSFFLINVSNNGGIKFYKKRTFVFILLSVFASFVFTQILQRINVFLAGFDVSLNFIDKFLRMVEQGDMSNGRNVILDIALEAIGNSPIFGYGIAQFENNTRIVYPHNFIVQMLYDGGLFLTLCVFIPIIRTFIKKIRNMQKDEFVCILYLFFASVPGALFSGDLWESSILWMLFGFILSKKSFSLI